MPNALHSACLNPNRLVHASAIWAQAQVSRRALHVSLLVLIAPNDQPSLSAAALGWDVLATDVPDVISCVLALNIWQNISALPAGSGKIEVSPLDWTRASESWTWGESVKPPFDLICSADTVYSPDLIQPFLRTIRDLCVLSASRRPAVFICLERRDPALIDRFLSEAKTSWDFSAERLSGRKLRKAAATHLQWTAENWEGIELWKLKYRY